MCHHLYQVPWLFVYRDTLSLFAALARPTSSPPPLPLPPLPEVNTKSSGGKFGKAKRLASHLSQAGEGSVVEVQSAISQDEDTGPDGRMLSRCLGYSVDVENTDRNILSGLPSYLTQVYSDSCRCFYLLRMQLIFTFVYFHFEFSL